MAARSSAAEIPAETTLAHQSHYEPALLLDQIHPHPKNVRHDATADQELVDSIASQGLLEPLLVAPHPTAEGYLLIAGHRRLDGLQRAGFTHAPAIVRLDLVDEADQVAAMLVENGRRADLTPLEEAEGYGQLRFDFGWKPGDIARAAGHTVETVNRRLKLLKLDDRAKNTLHDGQLSLDDAVAIAEFPAAEQKKLTKAAGTTGFRYALEQAKERRKERAAFDRQVKQLRADGVPGLELPAGLNDVWSLRAGEHGMVRLAQTFSRDLTDHQGCLAWVEVKSSYSGVPTVEYVCTDNASHDEQLDEQRRAARQAQEEADQARAERERAENVARNLRLDAILDSVKPGAKIDPSLVMILTTLLPQAVAALEHNAHVIYCDLLEIPEDARWTSHTYMRGQSDVDKFNAHLDLIVTGPTRGVVRAYLAAAAARVEATRVDRAAYLGHTGQVWDARQTDDLLAWIRLAERAGHQLTDVDQELVALATGEATTPDAAS